MQYEFTCGHVSADKIAYQNRFYVCPVCYPKRRRIRYRVIICENCGAEFTVKPRGQFNPLCVDCLPADERRPKKRSRAVGKRPPMRRTDCVHYSRCMMPTGRLMTHSKACRNCLEYSKGQSLDILDFMTAGDSFEETRLRVAGPAQHHA